MNKELLKTCIEIEKARKKLNKMVSCKKNIAGDDLILSSSQELDKLIVKYLKNAASDNEALTSD